MATFIVTNLNDSGAGSLRDAVAQANADGVSDTIEFQTGLTGTLTLTSGEIAITTAVTIDGDTNGDNKADITISGNASSRIFSVSVSGTDADLHSLTLTNGRAIGYSGGAVFSAAGTTLSISDSSIKDNVATWGGGIASYGTVTVVNSTISGNSVSGQGGGVFLNSGATASFTNTTLDGNIAGASGGAILAGVSTISLVNSTVTANTSFSNGGGIALSQSTAAITNSVIALNSASFNDNTISDPLSNSTVIASNSFFGTAVTIDAGNGGNINGGGDPLLGMLQDNGGTVMTRNIAAGSALINAGGDNYAPTGLAANGLPRIVGAHVDIGAAEAVPASLVVDEASNTDDGDYSAGHLSLREAVKLANTYSDANTITFDASLAGQTLTLTQGQLELTQDVTIDGGTNGITISGGSASRILMAGDGSAGIDIAIRNLTLADGYALGGSSANYFTAGGGGGGLGAGGAVFVRSGANLALDTVSLVNNAAQGGSGTGGGIRLGGSGPYAGFGMGADGGQFLSGNGYTAGFGGGGGGGANFQGSGSPGGFGGGHGGNAYYNAGSQSGVGGGGAGFGGAIFVHDGGSLTISGGGDISGGGVTGGSGYQNGSAAGAGLFLMNQTVTVAPDAGHTLLIADSIADDFGNGGSAGGSIVMNGAGTLELSGTSTFTGSTTVDDGLLKVTGSIANSEVVVNDGGTLGGSGTTGSVIVNSGGTLAPGSSPGIIHTGDLTLSSGATFSVEIAGATAGTGFDQAQVTGIVTLNGATLDVNLLNNFNPAPLASFTVIDNDAADAVSGTFKGLAEGGFVNGGGQTFEVSYHGGDGNDVTLTAVDLKVNTAADETYDGGSYADELADGGGLSLREAVALANKSANADTITFASGLAVQTLVLTGGELVLSNDVTIDGDTSGDHKADITISGNNASRIFNIQGGSADFRSLTLTNGNSGGYGGAISAYNASTLTISDCTISNNQGMAGGIYARNLSAVTIANSLLTGNTGSVFGGALTTKGVTSLNIVNTTIDGNTSLFAGGGIYAMFTNASVVNSTITGNSSQLGGGMYSLVGYATITNSVIAGNTGGDAKEHFSTTTAANSFFGSASDIDIDYGGNINGGGDPMLGELLNNGGTTLTRSPLDGSPLIGAGSNAALPLDTYDVDHDGNTTEVLPIDGRGGIRIVNGTVDIGAVEQIVNERIGGTPGNNHIIGGLGRDILFGFAGDDTLSGGNGRDRLTGGGGADSLDGGAGRKDMAVYKHSLEGVNIDLRYQFQFGGSAEGDALTNIENVIGSGHNDHLTGNKLHNVLFGLGGGDRLDGKARHDELTGGAGADTFVLHRVGQGSDTITDFTPGTDHIEISAAEFNAGLVAGALDLAKFTVNTTAQDADDCFIYNSATGELIFDSNGWAAGHGRVIATLLNLPVLSEADFLIV